jgi:hypothetical protein
VKSGVLEKGGLGCGFFFEFLEENFDGMIELKIGIRGIRVV